NLIVLDEAAYIDKDTIQKAVIPILQTVADCRLVAASTPSGNKDKFYEWSQTEPGYKEFYQPSSVLPHWERVKDDIQSEYKDDKDSYYREILALHGVSADGVYRGDLVTSALKDFKYEEMKPEDN
ncbi:hypothetical protein LRR18_17055, partial [Mangrovimonas sp. AS39]|uniref:hypothetical protein n=1 Tax=Mangrovimonas futianensis TaxID=2895523 RepID=UPI001E2FEA35